MLTTTLQITEIPIETFKALDDLALRKGKPLDAFVCELIEVEVRAAQSFIEQEFAGKKN